MVTNRSLDRLVDVKEIAVFAQQQRLLPHNLVGHDHSGLLLTRGRFVIEISEALRDISLVITLADARGKLWVSAEAAQDMCAQLGIEPAPLCLSPTGEHGVRAAFLSHMDQKLHSLLDELPPTVALLNHVDGHGGLGRVAELAPPKPFHLQPHVKPLPTERLALYRMAVVLDA
jgi:hypothetical protein